MTYVSKVNKYGNVRKRGAADGVNMKDGKIKSISGTRFTRKINYAKLREQHRKLKEENENKES